MMVVNDNPGKVLWRSGRTPRKRQTVDLKVTPSSEDGYSMYGESTQVGDIEGLIPSPRAGEVGISDPNSLAGKAGFQTGDLITALNGAPLKAGKISKSNFAQAAPGTVFQFKVEKSVNGAPATGNGKGPTAQYDLIKPACIREIGKERREISRGDTASAWGLHSSELFIEKVVPQSPAAQAGIKTGDRMIAVGGAVGGLPLKSIESFFDLKDAVQNAGEKDGKVQVQWEREGRYKPLSSLLRRLSSAMQF